MCACVMEGNRRGLRMEMGVRLSTSNQYNAEGVNLST